MTRQSPAKNGRKRASTGLTRKVKDILVRESNKYECSQSFIIAVALSEFFNLDIAETYK